MRESTPTNPGTPLFREEQRFRQWWIWVLVVAPAALSWWPFIRQIVQGEPVGQNPAPDWLVWVIWLFIGLGLPFFFSRVSMVLEVTGDAVHIHYRPFSRRTIAFGDIERVQARTYNSVKEYGGWGVKGWSKDKMAYNVSGNRGVELTLTGGRSVMIGSQRADELAGAIEAAEKRSSGRRKALGGTIVCPQSHK